MTLRELEITKSKVVNEQSAFKTTRDVWTAEFIFNDGNVDTTYCGFIHPWVEEEYLDYAEGGYVIGKSVQYTCHVEDIDFITYWREGEIGQPEETGALEYINPEIKRLWISDISQYMTDNIDKINEL